MIFVSRRPVHGRTRPWVAQLGLIIAGLLVAACIPLSALENPNEVWLSSTQIGVHNLSWSPAPGAEFYKVYYRVDREVSALSLQPDFYWDVIAEHVTETTYVDIAGNFLHYLVTACNQCECSTDSIPSPEPRS